MGTKKAKKPRGTLFLVRHAKAGERRGWNGDDRERPLSKRGHKQAKGLIRAFAGEPIDRLLTSPYSRCVQTLEPIAKNRGLAIEERAELEEHIPIGSAVDLVKSLAGTSAVLCSHGDVIPGLIGILKEEGLEVNGPTDTKKGSVWVIATKGTKLLRADYLPPA